MISENEYLVLGIDVYKFMFFIEGYDGFKFDVVKFKIYIDEFEFMVIY